MWFRIGWLVEEDSYGITQTWSYPYESNEKTDEAIEEYQVVIEKYSSVSPEISNVYFSIGRLFEKKSDKEAALEVYNKMLDNFPDSNWTNLARSRIIYLESR